MMEMKRLCWFQKWTSIKVMELSVKISKKICKLFKFQRMVGSFCTNFLQKCWESYRMFNDKWGILNKSVTVLSQKMHKNYEIHL